MPALYRYSIILDKMLVIPFSVSMLEIFTIQKRALKLLTYHVNLYLNCPMKISYLKMLHVFLCSVESLVM